MSANYIQAYTHTLKKMKEASHPHLYHPHNSTSMAHLEQVLATIGPHNTLQQLGYALGWAHGAALYHKSLTPTQIDQILREYHL